MKMIDIVCLLNMLLVLAVLTACSNLTSSFDCPRAAGVSCQSLDQINQRIDAGELPLLAALTLTSQEHRAC
jgi:hypothetical protein